jgi:serine/threonine protein kinase
MADQTSLEELLLRYDELRQQGQALSPEELCGDHPELLYEVRREIQELEALNRFLSAAASQTDPYVTKPASATPSSPFTPQINSVSTGSRYRLLRLHAQGGLGEVHLAHDEGLHREVALKFMQKPCAQDPNSRRRFLWEAEITSRLEHPNIVPVYALGQDADGHPFYARSDPAVPRSRKIAP